MTTVLINKPAGSSGNMTNGGSGRTLGLRRTHRTAQESQYNPFTYKGYNRMSFRNSKDPVYIAFDHLDKQPISKLAADFVKENIAATVAKLILSLKD